MRLRVLNHLPVDNPAGGVRLGLVRAEGVHPEVRPEGLEAAIAAAVAAADGHELRRAAARDMLRNGRYKPTGRGKPASEYLARAAAEGVFPRINALVDVANLISLREALPISLWDPDRLDGTCVRFRLGREGEHYVFNAAGQTLDLRDLVVGAVGEGEGVPAVSPVKDAQHAKTTPATRRVVACVYAPAAAVTDAELAALCAAFAAWLERCGPAVRTATAGVPPGGEAWV